ncbi:EAL domain-containing protein [Microvirga sp. 2YAF29]|uniref:EAL domain-containing protein n=1 Tax=Microvirga sp. 2YAF29 TaxID=3233031 RepID=UPI003F9D4D1F
MKAKLFVFALAGVSAIGTAATSIPAPFAVPALTFVSVAALGGLLVAWAQAEAASKAAQQAMENGLDIADRLMRVEQGLQVPVISPTIRTTMAEVTGTVSLLGGVVRELAKNVSPQNRDVTHLRDSLKTAPAAQAVPIPQTISVPQAAPAIERKPAAQPAPRKTAENDLRRMRLVTQAFEADGIELALQPIVALPQRKIRFYEALARLRLADGTLLGPSEFLSIIERLGRAPEFDRRVLNRTMMVARHLISRGSEAIVGVNLSAHSVRDPGFLWSLTGMFDAAPEIIGKVVLELSQNCWRSLDADAASALGALSGKGVPLSLDTASDLRFDARALADMGVRFVKLPAEMLVAAEQDERQHLSAELGVRDFASSLRREGIKLIAEHVEREDMVPTLAEIGVPLAQGFVFAAPRAGKAEVLGGQAQPASFEEGGTLLRRAG